ncbi:DUF3386 domain-containing protein [Pseudanabaena sp. FACHB-2040]|uniref:DUF3386 domain-containing protein n=1 Tax=Pseudanabaena sp. FACHB-2040 TaxID=2692859 RepID=UPI0016862A49|nr:DUF3386 domain-containing protein [Pseudanabaena sp. FACHB-2040]MBD0267271.1 DUF3386 domain-containing protein [Cyanobacteria bacterium Co-bin8]MBD2259589.1 DUF3386 domain-containing protein [Pseudanabaena sp. FACHB-2040]
MVGTQVSARELFRAAYENRYTWTKGFPGYSADVTYTRNGEVFSGQIKVGADLKPEVTAITDEEAQKAIHGQLFEIAIHRVRRDFEDTHGKNTFAYGKTLEDGSVEILMGGKSEGDRYQLRNNEVSLVHRHIHGVVVTINTFSSHDTGEGYLSHRYDSVYHDPTTGEQKGGLSLFEDDYEKVGDYHILSRRHIVTQGDQPADEEFRFSNIKLLG